jgi:hypothetical protein
MKRLLVKGNTGRHSSVKTQFRSGNERPLAKKAAENGRKDAEDVGNASATCTYRCL